MTIQPKLRSSISQTWIGRSIAISTGGILAVLLIFILIWGCGPSAHVVHEVGGRNAEGETLNYYFYLRVLGMNGDACRRRIVRIYPKNKLYAGFDQPPPDRLTLVDSDCARPIRFERASYLSDGRRMGLSEDELPLFWIDHQRLEHELHSWLFQNGT